MNEISNYGSHKILSQSYILLICRSVKDFKKLIQVIVQFT